MIRLHLASVMSGSSERNGYWCHFCKDHYVSKYTWKRHLGRRKHLLKLKEQEKKEACSLGRAMTHKGRWLCTCCQMFWEEHCSTPPPQFSPPSVHPPHSGGESFGASSTDQLLPDFGDIVRFVDEWIEENNVRPKRNNDQLQYQGPREDGGLYIENEEQGIHRESHSGSNCQSSLENDAQENADFFSFWQYPELPGKGEYFKTVLSSF